MAEIILTPTALWQVEYGYVTAKDPAEVTVSGPFKPFDLTNKRAAFAEFDVPRDAAYRHGIINKLEASGVNSEAAAYSFTCHFFKNNGVDLNLSVGKAIVSPGSESFYDTAYNGPYVNNYRDAIDPILNAANGKIYIGIINGSISATASTTGIIKTVQLRIRYTDGIFVIESSKKSGYFPADISNVVKVLPTTVSSMIEQYTVESGVFYYKKTSENAYTSIAFTGDSVTIPANTFDDDSEYNFYFTAVADDGSAATSEIYTVTTGDVVGTVTAMSPSNFVTYGVVSFAWLYENSLGNSQRAFDLQISSDEVVWTDVAEHEETPNTFFAANVPTGGMVYWRVRSYNQADVPSDWSNVLSFTNVLPPAPPSITSVTGTGRLTVEWTTGSQIAYQVIIGEYDSGWVYSTEKKYFCNKYLADGVYEIKVRITNNIGLVSEWATTTYSQAGSLSGPNASVEMKEGFNEISISGSFDSYYIIRNGEVIAHISDGTYRDYFCNGTDNYIVRGVNADDTFGDTILTGIYTCRKPALIDPDGTITYVNERLDEQPQITSSDTVDVAMVEYLGRSLPVHHVGQMQKRTWTVACSAMIKPGKIYFYRNFRGDKAWVICANVQSSLNWFGVHEYQYTLEETDYDEAVGYAV